MAEHHKRFPPSALNRIINCPGSANLTVPLVQKPNVYADEGTAAHALAAMALTSGKSPLHWLGSTIQGELQKWPVTDEMVRHIGEYRARALQDPLSENVSWGVEKRVNLNAFGLDIFGSVDNYRINFETRTLSILDLKYGAGVEVNVVMNPQLLTYALGVLSELPFEGEGIIDWIDMAIFQPRKPHPEGPYRVYRISRDDLLKWKDDVLLYTIETANSANPPLNVGPWCGFCEARKQNVCPVVGKKTLGLLDAIPSVPASPDTSPKSIREGIDNLSNEKLAEYLAMESFITDILKEMKSAALARAIKGHNIPGFKLAKKYGSKRWKADPDSPHGQQMQHQLKMNAAQYQIPEDELYKVVNTRTLKTPTQVITVFKDNMVEKKVRDLLLEPFYEIPDEGMTLVPEESSKKTVPPPASIDNFDVILDPDEDLFK